MIKDNSYEIRSLIKHKNDQESKRFYSIKFRFLGVFVEEAATKVEMTKKTGYYCQDNWNKGGYANLILILVEEESPNLPMSKQKN